MNDVNFDAVEVNFDGVGIKPFTSIGVIQS